MKVLIAGSREFSIEDEFTAKSFIEHSVLILRPTEVVSGKCPTGADLLGECFAKDHNIPIKPFPADWDKYGLSAGPRRNTQMVNYCESAIIIWDGTSKGTRDVLSKLFQCSLTIFLLKLPAIKVVTKDDLFHQTINGKKNSQNRQTKEM